MRYSFGNAQHIGARASQQDAFGFSNPFEAEFVEHAGLLAVLADGMGGLAHGDLASRTALAAFLAAYRAKQKDETVAAALARSLQAANGAVCELAARHSAAGELGTTLVAAVLRPEGLEWVSVGDSALFLFHADGFSELNTPHVYARDLDAQAAAGRISVEAAQSDPQRDALTSFLGLADLPHLDRSVRPLPLDPADCIVLASDGLFKTLAPGEMSACMQGNAQDRCDSLVKAVMAKRAEHQDNVTVLALFPLVDSSAEPLPATVRIPNKQESLAPTRPVWMAFVRAMLLTVALATAGWIGFDQCCHLPPPPPMPRPPGVPSQGGVK